MRRTVFSWMCLACFLPVLAAAGAPESPAAPSAGEDSLASAPTLAAFLEEAYRRSPAVKASREAWRASLASARAAGYLDNPELMLDGMWMVEELGEEAVPPTWTLTATQAVPLPGKLAAASEAAQAQARIERLRLDETVRDTLTRIRESYHELLYLQTARRVAAANAGFADHLRKLAETGSVRDQAAYLDIMKAQAQTGQVHYDAVILEELERTEKTRINTLVGRDPEAAVGPLADDPPLPVLASLEETYALAEKNFEEIRMADAEIAKASAMRAEARYMTLPEFTFGLSVGEDDDEAVVGGSVGLMIPLWPGKNAAVREAAAADEATMTAFRAARVNEVRAMVRDAWFRLRNADRLARLYREELVPQAERSVAIAETWYRQGQGSFSDFAEIQAAWYNFRLALARAEADYGIWLARLEGYAGRRLTGSVPAGEGGRP